MLDEDVLQGNCTMFSAIYNCNAGAFSYGYADNKTTMNDHNHLPQHHLYSIADGEWMMIHRDTFITDRERILMTKSAFMIDRDLASVVKELPVATTFGN